MTEDSDFDRFVHFAEQISKCDLSSGAVAQNVLLCETVETVWRYSFQQFARLISLESLTRRAQGRPSL